jgi:hypothetical protein
MVLQAGKLSPAGRTHLPHLRPADGDSGAAAGAQAQLRMRAGLCRRLEGLSGILGVAVNTVLGMNQIVEAMVRGAQGQAMVELPLALIGHLPFPSSAGSQWLGPERLVVRSC